MVLHQHPLVLWRDITPLPEPLEKPTAESPHILIIGGGVTGMVNAWTLLDQGYKVTVLAKEWATYGTAQRITSQIAGALWEYPPAVCGQHTDKISLACSKRWCMAAYHVWDGIASHPRYADISGVRMKPGDFYFPQPIEEDAEQLSKMKEIMAAGVRGFRRDAKLIEERGIDARNGGSDAYTFLAPIIDTDTSMAWLTDLVTRKGAEFVTEELHDDLLELEKSLRERFSVDAIINCTGLAGATLAGDTSCYPIRGGLIRVINDGQDFPKVKGAMTITADAIHDSSEIVFIVPRSDSILLLGGFTQYHEWELDMTLETDIVKRMRKRCEDFLPALKNARLDPEYPFAQGLRPFRGRNVRVERELRPCVESGTASRIVHSYGHGGAGWSLSWGCAGDVLRLVREALLDQPPTPMLLVP